MALAPALHTRLPRGWGAARAPDGGQPAATPPRHPPADDADTPPYHHGWPADAPATPQYRRGPPRLRRGSAPRYAADSPQSSPATPAFTPPGFVDTPTGSPAGGAASTLTAPPNSPADAWAAPAGGPPLARQADRLAFGTWAATPVGAPTGRAPPARPPDCRRRLVFDVEH